MEKVFILREYPSNVIIGCYTTNKEAIRQKSLLMLREKYIVNPTSSDENFKSYTIDESELNINSSKFIYMTGKYVDNQITVLTIDFLLVGDPVGITMEEDGSFKAIFKIDQRMGALDKTVLHILKLITNTTNDKK